MPSRVASATCGVFSALNWMRTCSGDPRHRHEVIVPPRNDEGIIPLGRMVRKEDAERQMTSKSQSSSFRAAAVSPAHADIDPEFKESTNVPSPDGAA